MRRLRVLGLAIVAVCLAAGCSSSEQKPGPNDGSSLDFETKATIVVDDNGIEPEVTKVHTGEAITVVNRGTKDHGLTSDTIEAGTLQPGESTTIFLTEAGTIELQDRTDLSHTARIEVSEAENS
jgi:hypothetical protein